MELGDKELERVVGHLIGRVQGAGAFRALRGSSRGIKYEEFVRVLRTASATQVEYSSRRSNDIHAAQARQSSPVTDIVLFITEDVGGENKFGDGPTNH